jgi:RNA polymerase sigma-70 factor, ECF subfamily
MAKQTHQGAAVKEIEPDRAKSLMRRIIAQDERALAELHPLLARRIYAFALNRLHDPDEAETVVSDTILEVWKHAARWDTECKLSTWVLGIANNKVRTAWRKRGEATEEFEDTIESEDLGPFEEHLRTEERAHIRHCMERLSDSHREALEVVYFQEFSMDEAGQALGCPPGTVKTRLFHARLGLRKCLERCLGHNAH